MKIRKAIKMAVAGAALAAPVGLAMAMSHTSLTSITGAWSLDGSGNISTDGGCYSGFTCGSVDNAEAGFMQRIITKDSTGEQFIQTILGEGVSGARFSDDQGSGFFGDESFVKMNGAGGIFGQNKISDFSGAGVFTSQANLATGTEFMMMETAGAGGVMNGSMVELQQGIIDTANEFQSTFEFDHGMIDGSGGAKFAVISLDDFANDSANGFTSSFRLKDSSVEGGNAAFLATTATADNTSKKIDIDSAIDVAGTGGITQAFSVRARSGLGAVNAGTATFDDGTVISFAAGESIYQVDLAQTVGGVSDFGLTEFQNKDTPATGKMTSQTSGAIPFNTVSDGGTPDNPFDRF